MKNSLHTVRHVAQVTGRSEQEVRQVNEFFWRAFRKKLSAMDAPSLYLQHVGTFAVSYFRLKRALYGLIVTMRRMRENTVVRDEEKVRQSMSDLLRMRNIIAIQHYEIQNSDKKAHKKCAAGDSAGNI